MKIALSIGLAFLFLGCNDTKSENTSHETHNKQEVISKEVQPQKETHDVTTQKIHKAETKLLTGGQLYQKCSACHGKDASKSALGKSKVIKGWSVEKITHAINGYKAGTYGGAMKGLMKSQVSGLNDAQVKSIAEHISKL